MQDISLRRIQPDDNAALAEIIKSVLTSFNADKPGTAFSDDATNALYQTFQQPGAVYFVAELNGQILGGGGIYPTSNLPEGYCELVKFYLVKGFRGIGLGSAILDACFNAATNFGYTHIYLESMPELASAVDIYKKRGFRLLKEPLGNSGHYNCTIWMKKVLHY
jgi:putative acetyltransferase